MISSRKKGLKLFFIFILFSFLSILFITALIKFGIPITVKFTSFFLSKKGSTQTNISFDYVPKPIIYAPFEATNSSLIKIEGKSFVEGKIKFFLNGTQLEQKNVNRNEEFFFEINLPEGENYIYAVSQDTKGRNSPPSENIKITLDTVPPYLEISHPSDESTFFGEKQKNIQLKGKTEEDSLVFINEHQVVVGKEGSFDTSYKLNDGENKIKVRAIDKAGNITEKELTVFFSP